MYFLGIGVLLLALKYMEVAPVSNWAWWVCLTPFAMAVIWWAWADMSGYTKRKAMEKEQGRKQARIDKSREALGMQSKRRK